MVHLSTSPSGMMMKVGTTMETFLPGFEPGLSTRRDNIKALQRDPEEGHWESLRQRSVTQPGREAGLVQLASGHGQEEEKSEEGVGAARIF
ncbi:hypothetical protein NC652_000050 [Populus alba x Populus x berolinensis]|nr:hypothetical protein NC652_000050 [Populus alba x Populus x berolinensis]